MDDPGKVRWYRKDVVGFESSSDDTPNIEWRRHVRLPCPANIEEQGCRNPRGGVQKLQSGLGKLRTDVIPSLDRR